MPILRQNYDLVVYRATPAGIMAAITGARLKLRTLLVEPSSRVGGMMTSGLNAADILNDSLINGVALEFFRAVRDEYALPTLPARIESRIALKVFRAMLDESEVHLATERDIASVQRQDRRITAAVLSDGHRVTGRWWVDASYEGDLMAMGGIRHRLGREGRDEYDEGLAGRQPYRAMLPWTSRREIMPRRDGALLPFVQPPSWDAVGAADMQVQSYCIRPTLTNIAANRVPITAPPNFDFSRFELFRLLGRTIRNGRVAAKQIPMLGTTWKSAYFNLAALPNGKFDMNSGPAAPLNNPVLTQGWIEASPDRRRALNEEFRRYTQALLYFMQTDASVPQGVRDFMSDFGLPADEYETSGHLPPDVYVREGRRLQGQHVFRQQDVENGGASPEDALCEAKYHLDCKPVHWRANHSGTNVVREGMFFTLDAHRYSLPAWIVLPHPEDCGNFFSVCGVSATHVAFGSIRMEPTWMELGSAAAIMAHLADRRGCPVHDVQGRDVAKLRDERFFQWPAPRFLKVKLRDKMAVYYRRMAGS
ncbi:FAD-dependent oxidoreductase [Paracoccus laeviglucosivorans]|uniref:FAD dependent oxidoreductase n=1 Tax=Paracoccus laeviglucosivorans TaxID=1197861 RepID=A0A521ECS7_9RHOB|nr:FAD-dependent oxidoreductase [Paracoccus laeviglucosivorans]SMO81723.1 FAD dependent oxidoreductase [Paracoccus laeviglucosivorans]